MKGLKILLVIILAIILTPLVNYAADLVGMRLLFTPLLIAGFLLLLAWALE